jgi:hypothetical protein
MFTQGKHSGHLYHSSSINRRSIILRSLVGTNRNFGKNLKDVIEKKLIDEVSQPHLGMMLNNRSKQTWFISAMQNIQVEGTCNGKYGYVVCVSKINTISRVRAIIGIFVVIYCVVHSVTLIMVNESAWVLQQL